MVSYKFNFLFKLTNYKFCKLLPQSPRTASGNECLQGICDGSLYKDYIAQEDSFLRCPWNISFTLNTDGVSVFSSSRKGHLWPVYLASNELPIEQRCRNPCCTAQQNVANFQGAKSPKFGW